MSLRKKVRLSNHWAAQTARFLYYLPGRATFPLPIIKPLANAFVALRALYWFFKRTLIAEPFFKAYCHKYGRRLRTGVFLHWISGKGKIIAGDDVVVDGCCTFKFAARYTDSPCLVIGSHTGISHGCRFIVGKEISIGSHCRLAGDVFLFDAPGHSNDALARMNGEPSTDGAVRPIRIGDNVWIGRRSTILPGVTIGNNAVVSTGSVVFSNIPENAIVAGNPARVIGSVDASKTGACEPLVEAVAPVCNGGQTTNDDVPSDLVRSVLAIVCEVAEISSLDPRQDFYENGLTSMGSVILMLRIEEAFHIAVPDEEFPSLRNANQMAAFIATHLRDGARHAA